MSLDWIWNVLSIVANVLQIGSVAIVVILFWRNSRRYAELVRQGTRPLGTPNPVALVVGLGMDIEGNVQQFLQENRRAMPVQVHYYQGVVPVEKFPQILKEINESKRKLTAAGVTEVHFFYGGPVTFAAALGAMLDNWVPVHVYAFEHGTYSHHLVLEKETVVGPFLESGQSLQETVVLAPEQQPQ
jgi:SMODS-associated and fused to various effectors sensor domain